MIIESAFSDSHQQNNQSDTINNKNDLISGSRVMWENSNCEDELEIHASPLASDSEDETSQNSSQALLQGLQIPESQETVNILTISQSHNECNNGQLNKSQSAGPSNTIDDRRNVSPSQRSDYSDDIFLRPSCNDDALYINTSPTSVGSLDDYYNDPNITTQDANTNEAPSHFSQRPRLKRQNVMNVGSFPHITSIDGDLINRPVHR